MFQSNFTNPSQVSLSFRDLLPSPIIEQEAPLVPTTSTTIPTEIPPNEPAEDAETYLRSVPTTRVSQLRRFLDFVSRRGRRRRASTQQQQESTQQEQQHQQITFSNSLGHESATVLAFSLSSESVNRDTNLRNPELFNFGTTVEPIQIRRDDSPFHIIPHIPTRPNTRLPFNVMEDNPLSVLSDPEEIAQLPPSRIPPIEFIAQSGSELGGSGLGDSPNNYILLPDTQTSEEERATSGHMRDGSSGRMSSSQSRVLTPDIQPSLFENFSIDNGSVRSMTRVSGHWDRPQLLRTPPPPRSRHRRLSLSSSFFSFRRRAGILPGTRLSTLSEGEDESSSPVPTHQPDENTLNEFTKTQRFHLIRHSLGRSRDLYKMLDLHHYSRHSNTGTPMTPSPVKAESQASNTPKDEEVLNKDLNFDSEIPIRPLAASDLDLSNI